MLRKLWAYAGVALAAGCAAPAVPVVPPVTLPSQIRIGTKHGVVLVRFEDYIVATALAEVGPAGESEDTVSRVFDVQAIIARTYAAGHLSRHAPEGFDLCDTTHCQVYTPALLTTSKFSQAAQRSVARTRGLVLLFSGRIAETLFHADCGGHTADAAAIWGGASLPYLVGRPDDVSPSPHMSWELVVSRASLTALLHLDPRSDTGSRLEAIVVQGRDPSGRATTVRLSGERVADLRGEDFRAILNRSLGDRAIRSTLFSVTSEDQSFRFAGNGYGHGVGLCQVGATARARRGESVDHILASYYPGARLTRVN